MSLLASTAFLIAAVLSTVCAAAPCHQYGFEGSRFTVCEFDASKEKLQLFWTDRSGKPIRSFATLERTLGPNTRNVLFSMNAGMFETNGMPLGLFVENSSQRRPLNTRNGDGNFYMKPNGVFEIDANGLLKIETSEEYSKDARQARWATQSGPMLVVDGELPLQIAPDGPSKNIRNGVGLRNSHDAFFAISEDEVSFGKLARFLRDGMGCKNALYFDGAVSSAWIPSMRRQDASALLGPMLVVSNP